MAIMMCVQAASSNSKFFRSIIKNLVLWTIKTLNLILLAPRHLLPWAHFKVVHNSYKMCTWDYALGHWTTLGKSLMPYYNYCIYPCSDRFRYISRCKVHVFNILRERHGKSFCNVSLYNWMVRLSKTHLLKSWTKNITQVLLTV